MKQGEEKKEGKEQLQTKVINKQIKNDNLLHHPH